MSTCYTQYFIPTWESFVIYTDRQQRCLVALLHTLNASQANTVARWASSVSALPTKSDWFLGSAKFVCLVWFKAIFLTDWRIQHMNDSKLIFNYIKQWVRQQRVLKLAKIVSTVVSTADMVTDFTQRASTAEVWNWELYQVSILALKKGTQSSKACHQDS